MSRRPVSASSSVKRPGSAGTAGKRASSSGAASRLSSTGKRRPSGAPAAPATADAEPRKRKRPAEIANRMKRAEIAGKQFYEKKAEKRKRRDLRKAEAERLGDAAPPKQIPHTLDNTRELDDTIVGPDDTEVLNDEADDEFATIFAGTRTPKIMLTTAPRPSVKVYPVIAELLNTFPESFYYKRGAYALKKIVGWATKHEFTHLVVLSERDSVPAGLVLYMRCVCIRRILYQRGRTNRPHCPTQ
jgi:hypothetical protein